MTSIVMSSMRNGDVDAGAGQSLPSCSAATHWLGGPPWAATIAVFGCMVVSAIGLACCQPGSIPMCDVPSSTLQAPLCTASMRNMPRSKSSYPSTTTYPLFILPLASSSPPGLEYLIPSCICWMPLFAWTDFVLFAKSIFAASLALEARSKLVMVTGSKI